MTEPDPLTRINALTTNARNTWFALLGVLLFVGITLMGVEHIDFYGVDRDTKLPLVDVSVPTPSFFVAAPILTAAIFGYFHLYLIRLWDALSTAPDAVDGKPLGDLISPWLVSDAALHLRSRLRTEPCTTPRTMEVPAMALNILLAWGFGLVVLFFVWWLSMPARTWWITLIAGASLLVSLFVGAASFAMLIIRMRIKHDGAPARLWSSAPAMGALLVVLPLVVILGLQRTIGAPDRLAPLDLTDEAIVEKPPGWLPYEIARKEFLADWCDREGIKPCTDLNDRQSEFDDDWITRRTAALSDLRKPGWHRRGESKPDLRDAQSAFAFLSGANLSEAQMQGANLFAAQMEGVDLSEAQMQGTDLSGAQMEEANFFGAQMQGANFSGAQMEKANLALAQMQGVDLSSAQMQGALLVGAQMEGANLSGAQMQGANLAGVQMQGTDLSEAQMEEANFFGAQMQGADLGGAQMEEADFFGAQMQGANLGGAQMKGVDLSEAQMHGANLAGAQMQEAFLDLARLTGTPEQTSSLLGTNLSASANNGGALRFVDLSRAVFDGKTDWRNAFLDSTVQMTDTFRAQMGSPCQWALDEPPLPDKDFYGSWLGWLQQDPIWDDSFWQSVAPEKWHDVTPIPPHEGCTWHTTPLSGTQE